MAICLQVHNMNFNQLYLTQLVMKIMNELLDSRSEYNCKRVWKILCLLILL